MPLLALIAASCTLGSGGAEQVVLTPVQGGSLTVGIDQAPSGCNPNATTQVNWASRLVLQAVLPSTFTVGANGQSTGNGTLIDQAELINTSPQTVVYTIDSRAVWSDGVPITATDFRYAWDQQRGTDAATGLPVVEDAATLGYRDIKTLTASNHGKTVTVVFKQPYAQWQMLFNSLLPARVMEKVGWNPSCPVLNPSIDLSGGPYKISSVQSGQVVLTRNPKWWGPAALLDRVVVRVASSAAQLSTWLADGTAQVVQPRVPTPAFVASVAGNPRAESDLDLSSTFLQLEFATQGATTSSVDLRDAIAHAIDRQALVNTVTGWLDGNVVPAQSHLYVQNQAAYPTSPSTQNALNNFIGLNGPSTTTTTSPAPGSGAPFPTTADPPATARLMFAAGDLVGADGEWETAGATPIVLRLAVDDGDLWAELAGRQVTEQLQQAGFVVQASGEPSGSATGMALASGAADLAILPFDATPFPSIAVKEFTDSLGPPGQNGSEDWPNLDDPTVDALLATAEQQLNPVKAQPIYAQVDAQLWTNMAALPLFAEPAVLAWSVQTYAVTPNFHGPNLFGTLSTWQLRRPEAAAASSSPSS